jgi:hypothetical protein
MRNDRPAWNAAASKGPSVTALVVIPESVNFFNNIAGRRLAEALRQLGWKVRVTSLKDYAGEKAEIAFLVSLVELFVSCGGPEAGRKQLDRLRRHCTSTIMWLLEPTGTPWFENSYQLCRSCGLDMLADNSLHDQSGELNEEQRRIYHHLFYGLTESEKRAIRSMNFDDEHRSIPWTFVGFKTTDRCELARHLVEDIDPGGFLYLTHVTPITEHGPHLKDADFQRVLRRSRFQIWRAHHSSFYMEGERFRRSALAGCIPLKVIREDRPGNRLLPFPYLIVEQDELDERLLPARFHELRSTFLEEYCRLPSLEEELARFVSSACRGTLAAWGIPA